MTPLFLALLSSLAANEATCEAPTIAPHSKAIFDAKSSSSPYFGEALWNTSLTGDFQTVNDALTQLMADPSSHSTNPMADLIANLEQTYSGKLDLEVVAPKSRNDIEIPKIVVGNPGSYHAVPSKIEYDRSGLDFMKSITSPPSSKAKRSDLNHQFSDLSSAMGYFLPPGAVVHGHSQKNTGKPIVFLKDYAKPMTLFHELTHFLLWEQRQARGESFPDPRQYPFEYRLAVLGEELNNYKNLYEMRETLGLSVEEVTHQVIAHGRYLKLMENHLSQPDAPLTATKRAQLKEQLHKAKAFQAHAESNLQI